jgi:nitrogen fixation protein FixH
MNYKKLNHPGNILITGFALMLLMMGLLVYLSARQDVSLVSKQYYEQELTYQQQIDARTNADAYPEPFRVQMAAGQVIIELPAPLAQQLDAGTAFFYCPSNDRMDRSMALEASSTGRYVFHRKELPGKNYVLKLSFISAGRSYYKEFNLF